MSRKKKSNDYAKAKKEILTPSEYADLRGVTTQAVTKAIRSGKTLSGISEVQTWGRFYLLKVGNWEEIEK